MQICAPSTCSTRWPHPGWVAPCWALFDHINHALRGAQQAAMAAPQDLYARASCCIASYPELDHYGPREAAHYAGHYYRGRRGRAVDWPAPHDPANNVSMGAASAQPRRILAYLRPDLPSFGPMLQALQGCGHQTVLAAPGLPAINAARFSTPSLRCVNGPVALAPLLPTTDLVLSYGSIGLVTETLLAGIPQLMLPPFAEQTLLAWRVEQMGAGISLSGHVDAARCAAAIEAVLGDGA